MNDKIDDSISALTEIAMLGRDAEDFFATPLGKFVLQRSISEAAEAVKALKEAPAHDALRIVELQSRIRVAESIPRWLNSLIIEGRQAEEILEEGKRNG